MPVRAGSAAERFAQVRRAEQLATLGADALVELNTESRSARQGARVWAVTRRAERAQTLARQRDSRPERRQGERAERAGRAERDRRPRHPQPQAREVRPDGR